MKLNRRQLRNFINEAIQPGEAFDYDNMPDDGYGPQSFDEPLFKTDSGKALKPTKLPGAELDYLIDQFDSDFVKALFDDFRSGKVNEKDLTLKLFNMAQMESDPSDKKEYLKALELAEEITGFHTSDEYLTQRGKDVFSRGGKYVPEIEASNYLRRGREGYSIKGDEEINENSKKLNRNQLRHLILKEYRILNEVKIGNFEVSIENGNLKIGNSKYSVKADAGWAGKYDVAFTDLSSSDEGLSVTAKTSVKTVQQILPIEKLKEIEKNVVNNVKDFTIKGKLADFIFKKIS